MDKSWKPTNRRKPTTPGARVTKIGPVWVCFEHGPGIRPGSKSPDAIGPKGLAKPGTGPSRTLATAGIERIITLAARNGGEGDWMRGERM